jgi:murein tripeptide amidase MpaA
MILARIRGTREELRSLDHSPIFLQRQGVRKIAAGRFEVLAVVEPHELSLLEISGYELIVTGEARTLLTERLRSRFSAADSQPGEELFDSVTANQSYMTVEYIEAWTVNLADVFPLLVELIPLPNLTWEGRVTHAVHLRAGDSGNRRSVVFTTGVHAGELGGPDASIYFLYRLLGAYRNNSAVSLGKYTVCAAGVQSLLNNLDLYVFPCVNPDGRAYVFDSLEWWRKNRNPNVGMDAVGVDINRNYDFLWSSGVGSSLFPQDDTYRGPAPFSEPETQNVAWLIKSAAAEYYMDIHGPSGTLACVWGDAPDQSTDPTMNFQNLAWDGRRESPYAEYLSAADSAYIQQLGSRVVAAVNTVRKGDYEAEPSYSDLYPTTATSDDYSFSRHLVDPTQSKTYAYTFEYGGSDFFPPYEDMLPIIEEMNAAMFEFCAAATAAQQARIISE